MSQGDEIMKKMSENYESLKSYLPSSYGQQNGSSSSSSQYSRQMMQELNNYPDNHHYMEDSPEPEVFDYQGAISNNNNNNNNNNNESGSPPFYPNRTKQNSFGGPSSQSQSQSNYNLQSLKPFFKTHERKGFISGGQGPSSSSSSSQTMNPTRISHPSSNPTDIPKKPYFKSAGFQGMITSPLAKYPIGGKGTFSSGGNNESNGTNPMSRDNYRSFQSDRDPSSYPLGEKSQGNHIAGTKIFVNNIEGNVNDEEIHHYFGSYGKINDLKVFHKNDQNYSYIIFEKYEDAFRAASDPAPKPNWTVSLAKSKNTVMQYQQSSLYNPNAQDRFGAGGAGPGNHKPFHHDNNGAPPFKKQFNKPFNNNLSGPSRYDKGGFNGKHYPPQRNMNNNFDGSDGDDSKYPADSHLTNIMNNVNDTHQLLDISMINDFDGLGGGKTQINQTILVREIWISNIDEKCKLIIKEVIEDNFGPVEEVDFFDRGQQSFVFVKFYMVQTAYHAFVNKEKIAELLETEQVKLTYSDPSRRRNIIGDHEDYMKDENLSPVLYISFPYGFKVNKLVIQKIASDYGTVLNVTVKRSDDPKQTSSVLIEFKDLKDTKFAFKHMREDQEKMNPKCEFAILLNSEKFVKENNLKLKEKIKQSLPNNGNSGAPSSFGNTPNSYNASFNHAFGNNYNNGLNNLNGPRQGAKKQFLGNNINHHNIHNNNNMLQDIAGNINSRPLQQQKGRKFSPEKELDLNSKRSYLQHKSSDISQEQGYNPDELYQDDDDDDENFIWSGFISINKKGRCGMDAKVIQSQGQIDLDYNLIMTTKCSIQEPLKFPPFSVLILKPTNETSLKSFRDLKAFLNTTTNQAGVINAKNLIIYLLPTGEEAHSIYPHLKETNILAICHTSDSIRGIRSKKDNKYEEKLQQRNSMNLSDSSRGRHNNNDEDDEDGINIVYDPTSILQDTTRPTTASSNSSSAAAAAASAPKRYNSRMLSSSQPQQNQDDYQEEDEDIYDPNQINLSKDDPKNTDLSDLIDNPALVDNMLKSLN